ncbi:hypothetical protein AB0F81_24630 [Actinoplanes sp. NPDC024001]|uniref:hypothetical protein n=1 Tax=Actinoplanes sp. NPDC024001 TaxID=3154598 RepID=UPI0033D617E7
MKSRPAPLSIGDLAGELRQRIAAAQAALAIVEHAARCTADDALACPDLRAKVATRLPGGLPA